MNRGKENTCCEGSSLCSVQHQSPDVPPQFPGAPALPESCPEQMTIVTFLLHTSHPRASPVNLSSGEHRYPPILCYPTSIPLVQATHPLQPPNSLRPSALCTQPVLPTATTPVFSKFQSTFKQETELTI